MKKLRRQYLNTMNAIDKYIVQGYQDLKLHDVAFECEMDEYFTFDGYSNIKTLNASQYKELIADIESDVLSEYL